MALKIRDRDNGYKALTSALFEDSTHKLDVGILPPEAQQTYDNGVTVIEAAIWNEFGTGTIPSRAWLRGWFDDNRDIVLFWFRGEFGRVVLGKQTKAEALQAVGKKCVRGIQDRILLGISPGNAPSTIAKKGFDHPLIGKTGTMIKAIKQRVGGR